MTEMVLDIKALPETILSKISTNKVKFYENNGTITLTPIFEEKPRFKHLRGMFSDGNISVEDFFKETRRDKELENEKHSRF